MTRRGRHGYPHARRAAAQDALANREELLARLRRAADSHRDAGETAAAPDVPLWGTIDDIPLRTVDDAPCQAGKSYVVLVDICAKAIKTGRSQAVLSWPARNISLAATYSLAVLANWRLGTSETTYHQPDNMRALYYPWSKYTRQPLRHVYVSKAAVRQAHLTHYQHCADKSDPLADLSLCLMRVADLDGQVLGGASHSEFLNPDLEELVPSAPVDAHSASPHALLHRCRSKTQLKDLAGGDLASNAARAPYFLYGIHGRSEPRKALRRLPAPVNLILVDLTSSGRNRFEGDWQISTARFLEAARSTHPGVPVVAVTDDPWVHRELMWRLLKEHDQLKGKRPAANEAIFTPAVSIIASPQAESNYAGYSLVEAKGFAGNLDTTLDEISALKTRARDLRDIEAEKLLAELASTLRRCANLPGGVASLGDYVAGEAGELAAINIMRFYHPPRLIAQLHTLEGPLAQSRREALLRVAGLAQSAWQLQQGGSPMQVLLKDVLRGFLRNSSKTILLLRNSMVCDYALAALSADKDIGQDVSHRVRSKMLFFLDEIGLRETTALPPRERHQVQTLIQVCPTRNQVLANLTLPWLPERHILLADGCTLSAVAHDASELSKYPGFTAFAPRLTKLASACQSGADLVYGRRVVLDPTSAPPADIEFPSGQTIDLTGSGASPNQQLIKIETESHQTILARPGTRLLAFDPSGAIPKYVPVNARDVGQGQDLCVISDDFVDMARTRLDIGHAANEEIRSYHGFVSALYAAIPASTERQRRAEIVDRINRQRASDDDRVVDEGNVGYWVDLSDELGLPLEEVTPHAPKDRMTFLRFTRALGIGDAQAERFWKWAVISTRSNRMRAAHQLHDAYLGILIAPHAAEAENPNRIADIRALRAAAERYVTRVTSCTPITRAELCK